MYRSYHRMNMEAHPLIAQWPLQQFRLELKITLCMLLHKTRKVSLACHKKKLFSKSVYWFIFLHVWCYTHKIASFHFSPLRQSTLPIHVDPWCTGLKLSIIIIVICISLKEFYKNHPLSEGQNFVAWLQKVALGYQTQLSLHTVFLCSK